MSCANWQPRIALWAGGEGPAEDVEAHLAECAACRETASAYKRDLELLTNAHREEILPAHYAAVRARVLAQLARKRRLAWLWATGAAAAALALVFLALPKPPVPEPPQVTVSRPTPPPLPSPAAGRASQPAARRVSKPSVERQGAVAKSIELPAEPQPEPFVVKLLTDDPDVIIYWIADETGD